MRLHLFNELATQKWAETIAVFLKPPFVMTLSGEVGTGKTTFVRALLRALHIKEAIKSPTFSLVETYELPKTGYVFHHFDLYRIEEVQSLEDIGFRDYFTENEICCIEWPEQARDMLGTVDLQLSLNWMASGRDVTFVAQSLKGKALLASVENMCKSSTSCGQTAGRRGSK